MRTFKIKVQEHHIQVFICHKEGHFQRYYPERKKNQSDKPEEIRDVALVMDGYDSAEVLAITETRVNKDWVLDSRCLFHMCPNRT